MGELGHRIHPGDHVNLRSIDPAGTQGVDHAEAEKRIATLGEALTDLQETHFAASQNAVLIVLQGPDTAGKDGTIRHVMASFNPAGCRVEAFKVPTPEERSHDFLWRIHRVAPPLGSIVIFNRSHYEDVLVTRVHKLVPQKVLDARYEHINRFEQLLADSGTLILKFLLLVSKGEQRDRLQARETDPSKAWKLSTSDWPEHELYDDYISAYELALRRCSTDQAPWYVVPADKKWFRNLVVAETIVEAMKPHKEHWAKAIEERGKQQLAAIAAQNTDK
jgi:PPK2 family polyphosphate:nucleotide phosphotransferase